MTKRVDQEYPINPKNSGIALTKYPHKMLEKNSLGDPVVKAPNPWAIMATKTSSLVSHLGKKNVQKKRTTKEANKKAAIPDFFEELEPEVEFGFRDIIQPYSTTSRGQFTFISSETGLVLIH
jgi:hypothetical protein